MSSELFLIALSRVTRDYQKGSSVIRALNNISFRVQEGEFVSIMGPSGAGKTTLLNILGGIDRPTSGCYKLQGIELNLLSDKELSFVRATKVGFVFQSFNLIYHYNVYDNVILPFTYNGLPATLASQRVLAAIGQVGLTDRLNHFPSELSGGEQQRVAIARAVAIEPILLLADEPTGNLDIKTGKEIIELFSQLNQLGATIIMVTHNPQIAERSSKIIYMQDGHISKLK